MIGFEEVGVAFEGRTALAGVSAEVPEGELCVLVGPSGSGKSTLLRLVNRLVEPSAGIVKVRGVDVMSADPAKLRRSIGYVIQSIGLFPHRSVAENVGVVPRLLGWSRERVRERVREMLTLVHLDPDILLMDEPFGAVDPIVRRDLRAELLRIHAETGKTIMLVTHDPAEALALATRLIVLREGRLVAAGRPERVMEERPHPFVQALLGADYGLHRLSRARVAALVDRSAFDPEAPSIDEEASLAAALSRMVETRRAALAVRSADGAPGGMISLARLVEEHP